MNANHMYFLKFFVCFSSRKVKKCKYYLLLRTLKMKVVEMTQII